MLRFAILSLFLSAGVVSAEGPQTARQHHGHRDVACSTHERQKLDVYVQGDGVPSRPLGSWRPGKGQQGRRNPRARSPHPGVRSRQHQLPAQPARGLPGPDPRRQGGRPVPPGERQEVQVEPGQDRGGGRVGRRASRCPPRDVRRRDGPGRRRREQGRQQQGLLRPRLLRPDRPVEVPRGEGPGASDREAARWAGRGKKELAAKANPITFISKADRPSSSSTATRTRSSR